jgi:hypothetical protein
MYDSAIESVSMLSYAARVSAPCAAATGTIHRASTIVIDAASPRSRMEVERIGAPPTLETIWIGRARLVMVAVS